MKTEDKTKQEKSFGTVKHLKMSNTTDGFTKGMDFDIEFNMLSLFVGKNGTGKSVILKLTWIVSTILNNIIAANKHKLPITDFKPLSQFYFDKSFDKQDITGDIHFEYTCGSTILIKLDKGKVIDIIPTYNVDLEPGGQPQFMSTNIRLFDGIVNYMKLKKMLGITNSMDKFTDIELNKLCDMYKIYDIIYMEMLFKKIDSGIVNLIEPKVGNTETNLSKTLKNFEGFNKDVDIEDVIMDYNTPDILYKDKSGTKSVTTLGNGEQALLNMFLGNLR